MLVCGAHRHKNDPRSLPQGSCENMIRLGLYMELCNVPASNL